MNDDGLEKMNHMVFTVFRAFLEHEPPVAAVKFRNSTKKRGQVSLRHTKLIADRCFLPDLAGLSNALLRRT
jgi:hypothetical protein